MTAVHAVERSNRYDCSCNSRRKRRIRRHSREVRHCRRRS
jgi:hypothetical protein